MLRQAYLASSSEESAGEEDTAALRDRYRSLLLANTKGEDARTGGAKGRTWGGAASGSDQDSDSQAAGDSEGEAEVCMSVDRVRRIVLCSIWSSWFAFRIHRAGLAVTATMLSAGNWHTQCGCPSLLQMRETETYYLLPANMLSCAENVITY